MGALPALFTTFVLLALLGAGCDRNTEPFVEGEEPRPPDLARIFPGATSDEQSAPAQPMGAADGLPPAAGEPAEIAGGGAETIGESIRGTIALSPELLSGMPASGPNGSLFVIARPHGVSAGPPLAVLRISQPRFPVSFEIGPENVMIPSMRFEGEIQISARLDSDGDAMTQLPGDLSGSASSPYAPGASDVDILLDTRI
jgi:hypothetical protein